MASGSEPSAGQSGDSNPRAGPDPRFADAVERTVVLVFYGWLVARIVLKGEIGFGWIQIVAEGMVFVFTMFRRPARTISRRPFDWVLALGATASPMLATGGMGEHHGPASVAIVLLLLGVFTQIAAKFWLGTRFGLVAAVRGVVTGGPYRYVRHPIYLGYLLTHIAISMMNPDPVNLAVYALAWSLQVPRVLAEERVLRADAGYAAYMQTVRWRLIQGIW